MTPEIAFLNHLRRVGNKVYDHAFPLYALCYRGYKAYTDRAVRQLLKGILSKGAVVVDAGANIGIYSRFLSRCVGQTGLVHSFEPSPENFRRLQRATRKLANVRLSQAALGEASGRSKLYVSDKLNVDHRTYATKGASRRAVPIEVIALDDYFKPAERVDLIKMDIQGYELRALRGANGVLADNPNAKLVLEFWPYGLGPAALRPHVAERSPVATFVVLYPNRRHHTRRAVWPYFTQYVESVAAYFATRRIKIALLLGPEAGICKDA